MLLSAEWVCSSLPKSQSRPGTKWETKVRKLCKRKMPLMWVLGQFLAREIMDVNFTTAPAPGGRYHPQGPSPAAGRLGEEMFVSMFVQT